MCLRTLPPVRVRVWKGEVAAEYARVRTNWWREMYLSAGAHVYHLVCVCVYGRGGWGKVAR